MASCFIRGVGREGRSNIRAEPARLLASKEKVHANHQPVFRDRDPDVLA
jgi:hypothetical protein